MSPRVQRMGTGVKAGAVPRLPTCLKFRANCGVGKGRQESLRHFVNKITVHPCPTTCNSCPMASTRPSQSWALAAVNKKFQNRKARRHMPEACNVLQLIVSLFFFFYTEVATSHCPRGDFYHLCFC